MNEAAVSKNKSDDREISRILQQLDGEGAFASCRKAPSGELHVSIRGFGNLRWPVRDAEARKLCRMAQLAHHGYKAETRLDKGVRDTWEISGDRLNIGPASWSSTLNRHLERLRRDLGLPGTCKPKAELHNLLIYTPGQFFSAHQDSHKHSRMVGTLAVVLPSSFGGGELIIEHRGESLRTGGSARELTLVGFYADCRHEVRPVKSGHRLVLTYHLMVEGDTSHGDLTARRLDELTEAVRTHFSGQRPPRWTGGAPREAPDKLVYLLDHEYTPRDLSWRRLKNGDSRRAAALREAAHRLDCEIFLTLADVHETWACEEDDGGRYSSYRDDDDDDDSGSEGVDDDSLTLTELIEDDVELRHWVDIEDRKAEGAGSVEAGELFYTTPSSDFRPYRSEYEGYMGNYGNTSDRWYHRAALVMWPGTRSFAVRAKKSPHWAIRRIAAAQKQDEVGKVRDLIVQLLPLWTGSVRSAPSPALLGATLKLAAGIDSKKAAHSLLEPFFLAQLTAGQAPRLMDALKAHGPDWTRDLFKHWLKDDFRHEDLGGWMVKEMPALCRALCKDGTTEGRIPAQEMVERLWKRIADGIRRSGNSGPKAQARELDQAIPSILALLRCGKMACNPDFPRRVFGFLTDPKTELSETGLVRLLQAAHKRSRNALRNLELIPLLAHSKAALERKLAAPLRGEDDWSIETLKGCTCKLCNKLDRFLKSAREIRMEWPLVEADRAHVHRKIDTCDYPVLHATRRTGRPFTLILEKTPDVFARDKKVRAAWKKQMEWVESVE